MGPSSDRMVCWKEGKEGGEFFGAGKWEVVDLDVIITNWGWQRGRATEFREIG